MIYDIERKGRAYQVRRRDMDEGDTRPSWPVVFGPRRKRDCDRFVFNRRAIEQNPRLQAMQRMAHQLLAVPNRVRVLSNNTCHALENHAAAARGEHEVWSFDYCTSTMTDPKDMTSEKAALRALRSAWVELVDLGVNVYPGSIRDPLYDLVHYDWGHLPEKGGDGINEAGDAEGGSMCYACADEKHVQALDTFDVTGAYLTQDKGAMPTDPRFPQASAIVGKYRVTTWTGGHLMNVTRVTVTRRIGFGVPYDDWTFRATDAKGREWSGRGAGVGMYCRLRLSAKDKKWRTK
jgi:hypothetical protein